MPDHDKATLSGPRGPAAGRRRPGRFSGLEELRQPLAILSRECASPPTCSQGLAQGPGCWALDDLVARRFSRKHVGWGDQGEAYTTERGEPQSPAIYFPGEEERKEKRGPGELPGGGGIENVTVSKGGDFQEEEDCRGAEGGMAHGLMWGEERPGWGGRWRRG